jgi:tryptophanyl-tRNA synthetase
LHEIYSPDDRRQWVQEGCRTAGIGCLDCKQPLIDAVIAEQAEFRERARPYEEDLDLVKNIVADGCERARELARQTMRDVREAMGLDFG